MTKLDSTIKSTVNCDSLLKLNDECIQFKKTVLSYNDKLVSEMQIMLQNNSESEEESQLPEVTRIQN